MAGDGGKPRRDEGLSPDVVQRLTSLRERVRADCNHYDFFGLPRDADRKAIKKAFYELAALVHPDRHAGRDLGGLKPVMEALFHHVTFAHEVLGDPAAREAYDRTLPPAPPRPSPSVESSPPPGSSKRTPTSRPPAAGRSSRTSRPPVSGRQTEPTSRPPVVASQPASTSRPPVVASQPASTSRPPVVASQPASTSRPPVPGGQGAEPPHSGRAGRANQETEPPHSGRAGRANQETEPPHSGRAGRANQTDSSRREALARRLLGGRQTMRRIEAPPDAAGPVVIEQTAPDGAALRAEAEQLEFRGEFTKATKSWRRLAVLEPNSPEVAHRTARALLGSNDASLHEAAELAKKAVAAAPRDVKNHLLLAEVYLAANLPSAARGVLTHALTLGSGAESIQALLNKADAHPAAPPRK